MLKYFYTAIGRMCRAPWTKVWSFLTQRITAFTVIEKMGENIIKYRNV